MNIRLLSGFVAALLLLIIVALLSWQNSTKLIESQEWIRHTHQVLSALDELMVSISRTESAQRAYLLTSDQSFLQLYHDAIADLNRITPELERLIAGNPEEISTAKELQSAISGRLTALDRRITTRQKEGLSAIASFNVLSEGSQLMHRVRELSEQMKSREEQLLRQRQEVVNAASKRTTWISAAGSGLSILMLTGIFMMLVKENGTRRRSEAALQSSESRLRALIENARDYGLFVLDSKGVIQSWNPGAERMNGYSAAEVIGKHFSLFYPKEDVQAGKPEYELKVAAAEGRIEDEGWRVRKDGHKFWANVVITAFRDASGRLAGFWKITRDLTERKLAEEKLRETATDLARSNAELEQFAYVASHDLQEPLRAVSGCVQILQKRYGDQLDDRARGLIQHSVEGAVRMQTLINDLLAYSRVTSKAQPLEPVDSGKVLKSALLNLDTAIKESNTTISYNGLPTVEADPVQLSQLFQNLVGNAVKYRGDRAPEVTVDALKEERYWHFRIKDNGIGIDPQYFDRIFRLFQRLHTRREYTGTGIGLALCKKIVERHGGKIWVESEPDKGSTFHFTLPAVEKS